MALTLHSTHLLLRDFVAEDWREVYAYTSLPEACQFEPWDPIVQRRRVLLCKEGSKPWG
jgi:hypothetical protein